MTEYQKENVRFAVAFAVLIAVIVVSIGSLFWGKS
jgi:hypothetical protein